RRATIGATVCRLVSGTPRPPPGGNLPCPSPSVWLIGRSSAIGQDEREAVVTCGLKVPFDRPVNLAERLPRVGTGVEPLKEQKINQHARHPVNLRLVANDRPATARLEEGSSESAAGVPSQDTAAAEVDEAVVAVVTAKGVAEPRTRWCRGRT